MTRGCVCGLDAVRTEWRRLARGSSRELNVKKLTVLMTTVAVGVALVAAAQEKEAPPATKPEAVAALIALERQLLRWSDLRGAV